MDECRLWDIRAFVYQYFAGTTRPPRVDEIASRFGLTHEAAVSAYEELHQRHAFFLKPGTHDILMANPFSGIETPFKVRANGRSYFANCALRGIKPKIGTPEDAMAALEATLAAEESARTGQVVRIG